MQKKVKNSSEHFVSTNKFSNFTCWKHELMHLHHSETYNFYKI